MIKRITGWSWKDKIRLVSEADGLKGEALDAFLTREGLEEHQLRDWEIAIRGVLNKRGRKPSRNPVYEKRLKELEKDLRRKDKALREAKALLELKKKVKELWGVGEDDTR